MAKSKILFTEDEIKLAQETLRVLETGDWIKRVYANTSGQHCLVGALRVTETNLNLAGVSNALQSFNGTFPWHTTFVLERL